MLTASDGADSGRYWRATTSTTWSPAYDNTGRVAVPSDRRGGRRKGTLPSANMVACYQPRRAMKPDRLLSTFVSVFASAFILFSCLPYTHAAIIDIYVGRRGDDLGLVFTPEVVRQRVGEQVRFQFFPSNHSVAQSTYANPCSPIGGASSSTGFFSGFNPVSQGDSQIPTFTINITSNDPIYFYCAQGRHCQSGMVGIINPPNSDTITGFKAAAAKVALTEIPLQPPSEDLPSPRFPTTTGGGATPTARSGTDPEYTPNTPAPNSGSATSGLSTSGYIAIAGVGVLLLVVIAVVVWCVKSRKKRRAERDARRAAYLDRDRRRAKGKETGSHSQSRSYSRSYSRTHTHSRAGAHSAASGGSRSPARHAEPEWIDHPRFQDLEAGGFERGMLIDLEAIRGSGAASSQASLHYGHASTYQRPTPARRHSSMLVQPSSRPNSHVPPSAGIRRGSASAQGYYPSSSNYGGGSSYANPAFASEISGAGLQRRDTVAHRYSQQDVKRLSIGSPTNANSPPPMAFHSANAGIQRDLSRRHSIQSIPSASNNRQSRYSALLRKQSPSQQAQYEAAKKARKTPSPAKDKEAVVTMTNVERSTPSPIQSISHLSPRRWKIFRKSTYRRRMEVREIDIHDVNRHKSTSTKKTGTSGTLAGSVPGTSNGSSSGTGVPPFGSIGNRNITTGTTIGTQQQQLNDQNRGVRVTSFPSRDSRELRGGGSVMS